MEHSLNLTFKGWTWSRSGPPKDSCSIPVGLFFITNILGRDVSSPILGSFVPLLSGISRCELRGESTDASKHQPHIIIFRLQVSSSTPPQPSSSSAAAAVVGAAPVVCCRCCYFSFRSDGTFWGRCAESNIHDSKEWKHQAAGGSFRAPQDTHAPVCGL